MKIKKLFKKKSFKLSLVFVSLVGMLASGGHSFAKYRDENYGSGNAGAAKFMIDFDSIPDPISVASLTDAHIGKMCTFIARFSVSFEECEVATIYNLELKLGAVSVEDNAATDENEKWDPSWEDNGELNNTSFVSNSTPISLKPDGQSYSVGTFEDLTEADLFENGKAYYGIGTLAGDTITYDWESTNLDSDGETLTIGENVEAKPGDVHYYSVAFFIEVTRTTNRTKLENSVMLYNLHIEQGVN